MLDKSGRRPIWIVDDSHLDAERARAALAHDHELEVFHDGAEVIERLAAESPPDLVVVDWLMPGVSGLDVLRFVRSSRELEHISVLFLTGRSETEHIVAGLDAGADDFVTKPFSGAELRARVDALVRARRLFERANAAERALRAMLNAWTELVIAVEHGGIIRFANTAAGEFLGCDLHAVVGLALEEVFPGDVASELLLLQRDLRPRDLSWRGHIFEATARPVSGTDIGSIVLSLRDVSEQRRMDEERRDFYAIVAHDMRSPLQSLVIRAELLIDGAKGSLPAAATAELRRMQRQIGSMSTLMNDFLQLSRLDDPTTRLALQEVDLDEILEEVARELQPLFHLNELYFEHTRAGRGGEVFADPLRIRQVVMNLLANALKFTPRGGQVRTSMRSGEDSMVEVSVQDTGPGIEGSELPHLFERYHRGKSAGAVTGAGLGLMIVRRIVRAHGGEVGVDSTPGEGSRFWFRLPKRPAAAFSAEAHSSVPPSGEGSHSRA